MIQSQKLAILVAVLLLASVIILGILLFPRAASQDQLKVIFLDVGQGDSILIKTPERRNILIDGGPDASVIEGLGRQLPFYKRDIDLMILTHPEADHVTGLVEVLKRYKVKRILYTGVLHTAPAYLSWLEEIKKEGGEIEIVDRARDISLEENLVLKILHPLQSFLNQRVEKLNGTSIVSKLIYGNTSFLFTADIEKDVESKLVENGVDLAADVLKVGHHGSKTSTTKGFLDKVNPEIAVIQVGKDNKFGHPHYRIIRALQKKGVRIFRNDWQGDVAIESDGENITVTTEK